MLQAGLALQQRSSVAAAEVRGFVRVAVKERDGADDNNGHSSAAWIGLKSGPRSASRR